MHEQWRKLVDGVSRARRSRAGRPHLRRNAIEPFYPRALTTRASRRARGAIAWPITQRWDHPNPVHANAEALHHLENGANRLTFCSPAPPPLMAFGRRNAGCSTKKVLDSVYIDPHRDRSSDLAWNRDEREARCA